MKQTFTLSLCVACLLVMPMMGNSHALHDGPGKPNSHKTRQPRKQLPLANLHAYSVASLRHAAGLGQGFEKYLSDETITGSLFVTGSVGIGTTSPTNTLHLYASSPVIRLQDSDGGNGYIDFDGSGSTGLTVSAGSTFMRLGAGDAERVRITSSGQVGIGTTSPGLKLTVQHNDGLGSGEHFVGEFVRSGTSDAQLLIGYRADGTVATSSLLRSANALPITLGTSSAPQAVTILNNGNMGIGVPNPDEKLTLDGVATTNPAIRIKSGGTMILRMGDSGSDNDGIVEFYDGSGTGTGYIRGQGSSHLSGGNLGIGISSPLGKLHVQTATQTDPLDVAGAFGTTHMVVGNATSGLAFSKALSTGGSSFISSVTPTTSWDPLGFQASNYNWFQGGSTTASMVLNSSGNMGIGTTSPGSKLELASSGHNYLTLNSGSLQENGVLFKDNGNLRWSLYGQTNGAGADNFHLYSYRNSAYVLTALNNGNVGIGTVAPISKLDVSGVGAGSVIWPLAVTNLDNNDDNDPSGTGSGIKFKMSDAGETAKWAGIAGVSEAEWSNNVGLAFYTGTAGQQERARITDAGNMGIGITNPAQKLDIRSNAEAAAVGFRLMDATALNGLEISYSGGYNENARVDFRGMTNSTDGEAFRFIPRYAAGEGTNPISIMKSGYMGIGTVSPTELLDLTQPNDNAAYAGPKLAFKKGSSSKAVIGIGGNYLGGSNTDDLVLRADAGSIRFGSNGAESMRVTADGNVWIGTPLYPAAGYKLNVTGNIRANKVVVNTTGADFVFDSTYRLLPLNDVETFIRRHGHLPGIVPAREMQLNGMDMGEQQTKLLQKVEELTLYAISQEKRANELEKSVKQQAEKLKQLEEKLNRLLLPNKK